MLIYEFRVVLPMTVDEYHIALLYSVAEASRNETGGGDGIEILINDPFDAKQDIYSPVTDLRADKVYTTGQYTHKNYHLTNKVPGLVRAIAPKGSLVLDEKAWNAYPYVRTVFANPGYMKESFLISIESMHVADRGTSENVHCLSPEKLRQRKVVTIDIANDPITRADYLPEEDPSKYQSVKTGRGPLGPNWMGECEPVMCCYKLVQCEFKWFGLQSTVEAIIQRSERRLFTKFHRSVFCWMDQWYGLTMDDIRELEDKIKDELDNQRQDATLRGSKSDE